MKVWKRTFVGVFVLGTFVAGTLRVATKDQSEYVNILDGLLKVRNERELFQFLDNTDGVSLRSMRVQLAGKGQYQPSLIPEKENLEKLIRRAKRWHSSIFRKDSVWLEWNIDGESSRRSLFYPQTDLHELPGLGTYPMRDSVAVGIMLLDLLLQLHPVWEDIGVSDTFSDGGISVVGGTMSLTTRGTLPGRIEQLIIDGINDLSPIGTHWIGIRPYYEGLANFTPVWELEDGTIVAGTDTTSGADGDASGGNAITTTFATVPEFAARVFVKINQVTGSNYHHMRGKYLVLLRYKATTTAASSFSVQIRTGFSSTDVMASNLPIQTFDTDDDEYHILELGTVEIPFGTLYGAEGDDIGFSGIQLWLERISGSASFRSDCFILIPAEHSIKIEGAGIATNESVVKVFTHENDTVSGIEDNTNGPARNLAVSPNNWYVPFLDEPVNGCTLVVASTRTDGVSAVTDTIDIQAEVIDRWSSYRTT